MGWFKSLKENLAQSGNGSYTILLDKDYDSATKILKCMIGADSSQEIISQFGGIDQVVYWDLVLDGFIHKDIPLDKTRLDYLKLAFNVPDDSEKGFMYFVSDSYFGYMLGDSFKQFVEFAHELSKNKKILNDPLDYERTIHPILDNLIFKYGIPEKTTNNDLGGINLENEVLYLPDSSPKMFANELYKLERKIPDDKFYINFLNFQGNQPTWKEALSEEKKDYFSN